MPQGQETKKAVYLRVKLSKNNPLHRVFIELLRSDEALPVSVSEYASGSRLAEWIFDQGLADLAQSLPEHPLGQILRKIATSKRATRRTSEIRTSEGQQQEESLDPTCLALDTKPL